MKWGIIGTGNMGSVLLHALTSSQAVPEQDVYLYNRTFMKAYALQKNYPNVHVVQMIDSLIDECDIIFLCAKPKEIIDLAHQLRNDLRRDQCVISITSSISPTQLHELLPCDVARMIPSITNRALYGVTLWTFPEGFDSNKRMMLLQTSKHFSKPVEISEQHVRTASDIVSCGPAFLSYILEEMIQSAHQKTGISINDATVLVEQMVIGFGKLFEEKIYDFSSLKEKVMVKGGITGEGMKALEHSFNEVFKDVFNATHDKFNREKVNNEQLFKQLDVK